MSTILEKSAVAAWLENHVQTTAQLPSFLVLARLCSKPTFKVGFSRMWTETFQMYKLGFEDAEEPGIKLPTFVGSQRKQGNFHICFCFIGYTKAFDCVDHSKLENSQRWEYQTTLPRNLYVGQEAIVRAGRGTTE